MKVNRRHIFKAALMGATGLLTGAGFGDPLRPGANASGGRVELVRERGGTQVTAVIEPSRSTPVAASVDVLVVGGGPAGVGAALAAAREGAKTLLIERHAVLGGMWTAGLLNPFFEFQNKGWIVAELVERLRSLLSWKDAGFSTFDTESMALVLETLMREARADYWYEVFVVDSIVQDGRVCGAIVESKAGREAILAKVVIDCTGDGDAAARAGASFQVGRMTDGAMQPMTLMFEISNNAPLSHLGGETLYDTLSAALAQSKLDIKLPFARRANVPWILALPSHGSGVVQATHIYGLNPLNPRELTRAVAEARRQAHDFVKVLQRVPGFESVRLTRTASSIGVRETRHIAGDYKLTLEDIQAGRRFDDAVTHCGFAVDVHDPVEGERYPDQPVRPYDIPYRCLLPVGLEGILTAGRCISGTHEAHASYRVTGTCMAMGQAAGLAGAWASKEGIAPREIPGQALHDKLVARGVGFRSP